MKEKKQGIVLQPLLLIFALSCRAESGDFRFVFRKVSALVS